MLIFTLLVALFLERTLLLDPRFDFDFYFGRLQAWLAGTSLWNKIGDGLGRELLLVAIPPVLVWLVLDAVSGLLFGLLTLSVWILVLLLCVGTSHYRRHYRNYVKAACRGDAQACEHFAESLYCGAQVPEESESSQKLLGQRLAWVNYRFYIAVICWAALLGPAGAAFYAACRSRSLAKDEGSEKGKLQLEHLLHWMDWLPVRICTLGYALVGDFSRAFSIWLDRLLSLRHPADDLLGEVVEASSFPFDAAAPCINKVCHQVALAKRNVTLMLAMLAVLTLYGWLI